jgi:hypothetical protein
MVWRGMSEPCCRLRAKGMSRNVQIYIQPDEKIDRELNQSF